MNAIIALELLSPIPDDDFIMHRFTNYKDRCCAIGHLNRLLSDNPKDYTNSPTTTSEEMIVFREKTMDYMINKHSSNSDIAGVNNGYDLKYNQSTPKERTITLLKDMIEDGWVD